MTCAHAAGECGCGVFPVPAPPPFYHSRGASFRSRSHDRFHFSADILPLGFRVISVPAGCDVDSFCSFECHAATANGALASGFIFSTPFAPWLTTAFGDGISSASGSQSYADARSPFSR